MIKDTKFRPGTSGCPEKQFRAGNRHRWPSGVSGNPAGVSRARLNFERQFHEALVNEGSVGEAAELLWKAARNGEAWAIQNLCQRFAPQAANLHVTHEVGDDGIDYSKLTDQQLEQLEAILERARDQTDPSDGVVEGRAVPHEASASGLGKPEASNCIPRTEREDDDAQKSHLQG